jgi:intracellular multiplication protein IcmE
MVDDPNSQDDGFYLEEDDLLAADPSAQDSPAARPSFKEIWRSNPSLKIFAGVAGIAILLISFMVFGSGEEKPDEKEMSAVRRTRDVAQAPGTAELPPAYEEAVRKATEERIQQAAATGGSALPTPIARPAERIEAPVQIEEKDPLSEWRREAEMRRAKRKEEDEIKPQTQAPPPPPLPVAPAPQVQQPVVAAAPAKPPPPPLPTGPTAEQIQAYSQGYQAQIQTVLQTQLPKESVLVKLNPERAAVVPGGAAANKANSSIAAKAPASAPKSQIKPKPIIMAGTIAYAQMIMEANSDSPGPIMAEVASGPLVGGRAIGTFNVNRDKMVLQFSRIVKDGVDYNVSAVAIDPSTTLTGMATDVDHNYWERVVIPTAARFIQAYAQAVSQQDTTVVVTNGTVVSESQNKLNPKEQLFQALNQAGQQAGQVITQDSQTRQITVKVAMGTRIGLLFTNNVYDAQTQANMAQQQPSPQQQFGQAVFNASPVGQMYNAANNVWGSQQQLMLPNGTQQQMPQQYYTPPPTGLTVYQTAPPQQFTPPPQ